MVFEVRKHSDYDEMLSRASRIVTQGTSADGDRPVKRLKTSHGPSSVSSRQPRHNIIPDSDAESGDEDISALGISSSQRTDLEQAAPPISTDKQAIEEYETMRAAEGGAVDESQSWGKHREWVKGKSSIYVDAFNLALGTVLEEESHLFDAAEMTVFEEWRRLSYEAQYLYVRLFLRKTSAWFRINKLGYYSDIADMRAATEDLFKRRSLPTRPRLPQISPGEHEPPKGTSLDDCFTFADCSEDHISLLEEASSLLNLEELKTLSKEAKVHGKNKSELLRNLRLASGRQTGLAFANSNGPGTTERAKSSEAESREQSPQKRDSGNGNRDEHFVQKIMRETGTCVRLSLAPFTLFERVHLVFYRSSEWTEKSLTTIILARIARRNFPDYVVSRSANVFASRSMLLEFEASIRTQFRIDSILEFNGTPNVQSLQSVLDTFEQIYPRWKVLIAEEQRKEDSIYASGEGAYLRRLSPAWVYTRIIHKGAYVLGMGKFKQHLREHAVLSEMLSQHLFHASRRGAWYQRKALLEEHYMPALTANEGRSEDEQKRYWKRVALRTCEEGLQDNLVHLIYHYDLQRRITKLEKSLKVAKRLQHDFGHTRLAKPEERTVSGTRVDRPSRAALRLPAGNPPARLTRSDSSATDANPTRRGTKTIWLDPAQPSQEVSVEAMALSHYRALGYKGFHSEGGILRTLFALLFHDVLFSYIPNVFQTPFQTCPLDLHTDAFFGARMSEINARLAEIANGAAVRILRATWCANVARRTCIVGLDWSFELGDLEEIVDAFGGQELSVVLCVMAQEYAVRGGGVPDLFLWKPGLRKRHQRELEVQGPVVEGGIPARHDEASDGEPAYFAGNGSDEARGGDGEADKGMVMFAEVKSENDRLSDTQRLWIHVLTNAGIRVELCNAMAKDVVSRD